MSIKLRLTLANVAMVIIPIILFFIATLILSVVFLGDIREVTQLLPESHSRDQVVQQDTIIYNELKKKSVLNPEELLDKGYLTSLEQDLKEIDAGLLIRKNNQVIYSSQELTDIQLQQLPIFGTSNVSRNLEQVGDRTFAIKQHDYYDQDGAEISILIMRDASPWKHFVKTFFPILFALCLVILIVTNGMITSYVSRSIIKPIERLKTAARTIKDGNLNHSIQAQKKDEIGELTQAFEEMRIQLNESFAIQKQYEENRKELIAHISHDLKTPITAIKGYVEGFRDGVANTPEKQQKYIQIIHSKARDMDYLIDELFLYSKLDLKKIHFHFEEIDLRNYLEDFIEELCFDFEKKGVALSFDYEKNVDYQIIGDREKLKRVFSNIIENSMKYCDKESKEIELSLRKIKHDIEVEIKDNGPGIAEESLPFVFEQFYRAEQSRNILTGGSGLGLSIAKMIIDEHQGTIRVKSKPGFGTKMTISFPSKQGEKR